MNSYLLAIDPGKASGVALVDTTDSENPVVVWSEEWDQFKTCQYADFCTAGHMDSLYKLEVVCESFHITAQTAKKSPGQWSSEIIGALRYFCERSGVKFTLQTPTNAKNFVDNDRLRRLGFWHKGDEGHANDALRHAVLYLVEKKNWSPPNLVV